MWSGAIHILAWYVLNQALESRTAGLGRRWNLWTDRFLGWPSPENQNVGGPGRFRVG